MDRETKPPLIHVPRPLPTATSTIPELISYLRSTYQNFDLVQSILLAREQSLNKSVKEMSAEAAARKKELELSESKQGQLVREKVMVEEELKKCRVERDGVRDDVKRARFECDELREKVTRSDEELKLYVGRERRADERYEKLVEESRETESGLRKMIKEYSDRAEGLREEKRRAEAEIVAWKEKLKEYNQRILKLEEDILELVGEEEKWLLPPKGKSEQRTGVEVNVQTKGRASNLSDGVLASPGVDSKCHFQAKPCNGFQGGGADSSSKKHVNGRAVHTRLVGESRTPSQMMASPVIGSGKSEVIDLDDSDDDKPIGNEKVLATTVASEPGEKGTSTKLRSAQPGEEDKRGSKENTIPHPMPNRKRASSSEILEANNGQHKMRRLQEIGHELEGPANQDSPMPNVGAPNVLPPSCHNLEAGEKGTSTKLRSAQPGVEDKRGSKENTIPHPMPNRKGASSSEILEANSGQHKMRRLQEIGHEPEGPAHQDSPTPNLGAPNVLPPSCHNISSIQACEKISGRRHQPKVSSTSSDTSDTGDQCLMDSYKDKLVAKSLRERESKAWRYEVDMVRAFEKDIEICMNAVCAIYRQQKSKEKSSNRLTPGSNQGFTQFDVLSGTKLAELLIDGDPRGKLRKSVSDLQQKNPKALDECRKLANRYSTQLFQIYKSKKDPYFLPS